MSNTQIHKLELEKNQSLSGFTLLESTNLDDLKTTVYNFEHYKTGAKLAYLAKDDPNKTFGVIFKTIPTDLTGVAHILEHVVLCGSKKYPVKDPFFSMLKRSLQNFMNAMTDDEWTMYPFSTLNQKDFFNLLDVYLDAAFFPLIREPSFLQEGWRFDVADSRDIESKLVVKGVVYNEMKGVLSTVSDILGYRTLQSLFPDVVCHHNSGGEPEKIIDLTWSQLKNFHRNNYHPANAFFYLYGNLDLSKTLEHIDQRVLSKFDEKLLQPSLNTQKRFKNPQSFRFAGPPEQSEEQSSQISLSWVIGLNTELDEVYSWILLDKILLSSSASLLRKALISSKLGTNLSDNSGFVSTNYETYFSVGLKGVKPEDVNEVEPLIISTLQKICEEGIDQNLIDVALHEFELSLRDIDSQSYSMGLFLLFNLVEPWIHGKKPAQIIDFNQNFKLLKSQLEKKDFLQNLIQSKLLQNLHRVKIELYSDNNYISNQNELYLKKISELDKNIDLPTRKTIIKQAEDLQEIQKSVEDTSLLPKVGIEDIILEPTDIKPELITKVNFSNNFKIADILKPTEDFGINYYMLPTNMVVNLKLDFGLKDLTLKELDLLSTLGLLLTDVGTSKSNYTDLAIKIARYSSGINFSPRILSLPKNASMFEHSFTLQTKSLAENYGKLLTVIEEIIFELAFKDTSRVEDLLKQRAADLASNFLYSGHLYAIKLASKNLHPLAYLAENYSGINQIKLAKSITKLSKSELQKLISQLSLLAGKILKSKPKVLLIAPDKAKDDLLLETEKFLAKFNQPISTLEKVPDLPKNSNRDQVCLTSTQVSYMGKAFKTPNIMHELSPALVVLSKLLRGEFLHREIREKGGAYGSMSGYDKEQGLFFMASYRDPGLTKTWQVFENALNWAISADFKPELLESAIVQTFGSLDIPLSNSQKAVKDYNQKIMQLDLEFRTKYRKALLKVDQDQIKQAASLVKDSQFIKSGICDDGAWRNLEISADAKYEVSNL